MLFVLAIAPAVAAQTPQRQDGPGPGRGAESGRSPLLPNPPDTNLTDPGESLSPPGDEEVSAPSSDTAEELPSERGSAAEPTPEPGSETVPEPPTEAVPETVPEPPAPVPGANELRGDELIRWAANQVRIYEGRPLPPPRPPVPPDNYIGGEDGPLVLPDQTENDVKRFFAELGGGALGVLVGGGLGALIVWAAVNDRAAPQWQGVAVGTAVAIGTFSVAGGVVLGADLTGGYGNFGVTFIGEMIGCAAALPLVTLALANGSPAVAMVSAGVLPLAGAILAYEISHANSSGLPTSRQVAFLSPVYGGAIAGVRGSMP